MKAETPLRKVFFGSTFGLCLILGLFWAQIGPAWPELSAKIAVVATNPESWFVIFMFVAAILAFQPVRKTDRKLAPNPQLILPKPAPSPVAPLSISPEPPPAKNTLNNNKPTPELREFIDTTPAYLFGISRQKDRTTVQNRRVLEPYIGKWIKVTGTVVEVTADMAFLRTSPLIAGAGNSYFDIALNVADSAREEFHMLEIDKVVGVIGKIHDVGSLQIDLRECEIVKKAS